MSQTAKSMLLAKRRARERGFLREVERLRKARIDAAAAHVSVRLKARAAAQQAIRDAEDNIGEALRRLLAEKLTLKQSAELCELTIQEVRRLSRRMARTIETETRAPEFTAEAHRQSAATAASEQEADDQAFVDATSWDWDAEAGPAE